MRRRAFPSRWAFWLLLLAILLPAAPAAGQAVPNNPEESTMILVVDAKPGSHLITRGDSNDVNPNIARYDFHLQDKSFEGYQDRPAATTNTIEFRADFVTPGARLGGWVLSYVADTTVGGLAGRISLDTGVSLRATTQVSLREVEFLVRAYLNSSQFPGEGVTWQQSYRIAVAPQPNFFAERIGSDRLVLRPGSTGSAFVQVRNADFYPAMFRLDGRTIEADGIPGDLPILGLTNGYLLPGEERTMQVQIVAPRERFWYRDVQTIVFLEVQPVGGGAVRTEYLILTVSGFYVSPNLIVLVLAAIAQILLLIWLIVFAKRAYERRYLGRPGPPWTIPEERANLLRLKERDPRAYYIMRHFLMEEEYRSALLWFFAYKKVSAGRLKAEQRAISLRQEADNLALEPVQANEKRLARIQRRYARKMARVQAGVDRKLDRLQGLLEDNFEKDHAKEHAAWEARVAKMRERHARPLAGARKKWQKETARILAAWEKPFRRDKQRYLKALAKAKAAYAVQVKKADKPTWRMWRDQMEDWEGDVKLAKKEGQTPPPEPVLMSAVVGPPELPEAFQEPARPDLPPEPVLPPLHGLPPEPQLIVPPLGESRYRRKARRIERKGHRQVRGIELDLAEALDNVTRKGRVRIAETEERRLNALRAADLATQPTFMDRVLRKSPEAVARRQRVAYTRGRVDERIREARENSDAHMERLRMEARRREADLEAQVIRARSLAATGPISERATARARAQDLDAQRRTLRADNKTRLDREAKAEAQRLKDRIILLRQEGEAEVLRQTESSAPAPPATPTRG